MRDKSQGHCFAPLDQLTEITRAFLKMRATAMRVMLLALAVSTTACTSVQVASDKLAEKALGVIGVKLPENPNLPRAPKTIRMKVETAKDLNAGENGQGLSTIFRVYQLKDQHAFLSAPYSVFGHQDKEKDALGSDLLEVREMVLSPGQTLDLKEKITADSTFLGVVALYRMPSQNRWRFAFAAVDAEKNGITLGLHACAMTATSTPPIGMTSSQSALLSTARCK